MSQYDPEQFGRLSERVSILTTEVEKMRVEVANLVALVNQGRGAFWLAVLVGGAISSAVTWILTKVGLTGLIR